MKALEAKRHTPWRFVRVPRNLTDDWLPDLTRAELVCYLLIARRTNDSETETASIPLSEFAAQCNLSRRHAMRALDTLEDKRLIVAQKRLRKTTVFSLSTERRTDWESGYLHVTRADQNRKIKRQKNQETCQKCHQSGDIHVTPIHR